MCCEPMILDDYDNGNKGTSTVVRFGNDNTHGNGVSVAFHKRRKRSDIRKWRNRMLLHRKLRKMMEKKRWKQEQQLLASDSDNNIMKRHRKPFRTNEGSSNIPYEVTLDRINAFNCYNARMYLLDKVRLFQATGTEVVPDDLVGLSILSEPRKRALFQASVRMCAAEAGKKRQAI